MLYNVAQNQTQNPLHPRWTLSDDYLLSQSYSLSISSKGHSDSPSDSSKSNSANLDRISSGKSKFDIFFLYRINYRCTESIYPIIGYVSLIDHYTECTANGILPTSITNFQGVRNCCCAIIRTPLYENLRILAEDANRNVNNTFYTSLGSPCH